MITGVDTILCQTDDMDRAIAFYRDTLGLSPYVASPHFSGFMIGATKLAVHPRMHGEPGVNSGNWIAGLSVQNLDSFRARLRGAGAWCAAEYHDIPGGKLLDFKDPDGNMLQAVQRN